MSKVVERLFGRLLAHPRIVAAALLVLTGVFGSFAARVRTDYRIEDLFPIWDEARQTYDRFKTQFPFEDGRALVLVQADDVLDPAGLRRLQAIEEDFRRTPDVLEVEGPLSTNDITSRDDWVSIDPLFTVDSSGEALAGSQHVARTDPLFAWSLVHPDGKVVTIRVTLTPSAAQSDRGRTAFLAAAREIAARHTTDEQRVVVSGIPVIRASYNELINSDSQRLVPLAMLAVLILLWVSFGRLGAVAAGLGTIVAALVWSYGAMGMLGFPITMLGTIMPIVVVIISISDTVHILSGYYAGRDAGKSPRAALVEAMADSAMPCLLTEVVLACGFLSLITVGITAILQFGVATAMAMLLTWLANMLVLPLIVSIWPWRDARKQGAGATVAQRGFTRAVDWIGAVVARHPVRVALVAAAILGSSTYAAFHVERLAFAFDGLRPDSAMYRDLRFAEASHGGLVPIAIYIETTATATNPSPAYDPRLIQLAGRAALFLETFPEIQQATSVADPLRKAHQILSGAEDPHGLPRTATLVAQEISLIDDGKMLRDYVSFDRTALVAIGYARDVGSERVQEMFRTIDTWVAAEQSLLSGGTDALPGVQIQATGTLRIFKDVNDILVRGLLSSLGAAMLVTIVTFSVVLRSWRLGLIGLVPNLTPVAIVFGVMWLTGIALKPETVIAFSITLVIADDDTIQFLTRYRRHYRAAEDALGAADRRAVHAVAVRTCMRETGLPMFVTSTSVSAGFLLLLFANLTGAADLGVIIGTTLFAAVFADMFLMPLLLVTFKPRM